MNVNNFSDNSIKYINECYLTSYDICTYPHVVKFANNIVGLSMYDGSIIAFNSDKTVHYVVTNIYTDYNEDLSPKSTAFSFPEQMEIVAVSDSLEAEQVVTHLFDKFEYFKYFGDMNLDGDNELLLNPSVWRYISLKNTKPAPKPKLTKKDIEKLLGYKIDIVN